MTIFINETVGVKGVERGLKGGAGRGQGEGKRREAVGRERTEGAKLAEKEGRGGQGWKGRKETGREGRKETGREGGKRWAEKEGERRDWQGIKERRGNRVVKRGDEGGNVGRESRGGAERRCRIAKNSTRKQGRRKCGRNWQRKQKEEKRKG